MTPAEQVAKNIAALRQHHPALAARVTPCPPTLPAHYADGDTDAWAEQVIRAHALVQPRLLFQYGFGRGQLLRAYLRAPDILTRNIVVIEPDRLAFQRALQQDDLSDLFSRPGIDWIVGADDTDYRATWRHLFGNWTWLLYHQTIAWLRHPTLCQRDPATAHRVAALLQETIDQQYNRFVAHPRDGYAGIDNTLANLPRLARLAPIDAAKNIATDLPGIVIASGPSLEASLPALQKIQRSAVLVACPSALPLLLQHNIAPHCWLHIERTAEQGEFFHTLQNAPPHIFVGTPQVHPRAWQHHDGLNVYQPSSACLGPWLQLPGDAIELGHSSAHAAFALLQRIGCRAIYLVGQDLAYADNASHAAGTWDASHDSVARYTAPEQPLRVPGNSGANVVTNPLWLAFLRTYVDQLLPRCTVPVYHVIPQQCGARIAGAIRIDPADLPAACPAPAMDLLPRFTTALAAPGETVAHERLQQWRGKLRATQIMLQQVHQHTAHAAQILQQQQAAGTYLRDTTAWHDTVRHIEAHQQPAFQLSTDQRALYEQFAHHMLQGLQMRHLAPFYGRLAACESAPDQRPAAIENIVQMWKEQAEWIERTVKRIEQVELL